MEQIHKEAIITTKVFIVNKRNFSARLNWFKEAAIKRAAPDTDATDEKGQDLGTKAVFRKHIFWSPAWEKSHTFCFSLWTNIITVSIKRQMSIETVHTSAIAVLGVEVSLFRGVAFLPSPPIPINLDKKELIKRTAFSRNQACSDDLVGLYPDINCSNRSGPVYVYLYNTAAFDVLLCAWA